MLTADDLRDPVGYDDRWVVLAAVAVAAVVVYYAAVLWWTRARRDSGARAARGSSRAAAGDWTGRLDEVERDVARGAISAREGHQRVSRIVREHVAATTGVAAGSMALGDLRRAVEADPRLRGVTDLVALLYPPAFAADPDLARARFDEALATARRLVAVGAA